MEIFSGWFTCIKATQEIMEFSGLECKQNRRDSMSLAACKGREASAFSYGIKGSAKYQLNALATFSSEAVQSVATSCSYSSQPTRMHGWNGKEFDMNDNTWNVNYSVDKSMDCKSTGDSDTYMIYTRVPNALPITDIDVNTPGADETLMISVGEVCYA